MPFPSVPRQAPLPVDAIQSAASFGLRLLKESYSGNCVAVRNASSVVLDIGFVEGGLLDTAALLAHCGSGDGWVETWYDQSGNGADLSQSTTAEQPLIVQDGELLADGSSLRVFFPQNTSLSGTVGAALSSSSATIMAVVKELTAYDSDRHDWFGIYSGASPSMKLMLSGQDIYTATYQTPGNNVFQTSESADRPMVWSRFQVITWMGSPTEIKHWRNDQNIGTWTPTNTGATGTGLWVGSVATRSMAVREFHVYGQVLSASQIAALYESVNEAHSIGPRNRKPTVALEERHLWESVLRDWMADLTDADRTVTSGTFTWDGTYADTDELLRIYLHSVGGFSGQSKLTEGLLCDPKWWRLFAINEIGIESDYPLYSQSVRSPGIIRQFVESTTTGSQGALWANWYSWNLPKAGAAQGNPFYMQRGVAVRALIDACVTVIQKNKEADILPYEGSMDIFGGTINMAAWIFKQCRNELPLFVQEAFLQALRYSAHRISYIGPRSVNANMDCKGLQALATIYAIVPDTATKQECIAGVKNALFGSTTGTPDTALITGIYDNAGHIKEGGIGTGSPETTYNGHSLYHLIGALSHVRGDPDWDFLATVIDRMAKFKYAQYFVQPGGSFDGPGGYGGRTGGCRVRDQGFEPDTHACISSFSLHGRPGNTDLENEAGIVADINAQLANLNANLAVDFEILSGTGAHTNGLSCLQRDCTVQFDPANTLTCANHDLPNDSLVYVSPQSGRSMPENVLAGLYYVVNSTENTLQLSATQGGSALTLLETANPSDTVGPLIVHPVVFLTDSPSLNYTVSGSCVAFLLVTIDSVEWAGEIIYANDSLDVVAIRSRMAVPSGTPVAYSIVNGPRRWTTPGQHWPVQGPYFPDDGYYDSQRARIIAADDTLKTPWELTDTFSEWYNDDWWFYKNIDTDDREFGWMIECVDYTGAYAGWYGGKVEEYWTRDGGTVIRCRHDKSGDNINQGENTRVWSQVDQWATMHVWGKDSSDKGFSNATGEFFTFTRVIDKTGPPISVEVSATANATWKEPGSAITGSFSVSNTFETSVDGLVITHSVTHTGSDNIGELWATIPVYLRNSSQAIADTVIQYWNGASWNSLSTTIVSTTALRLGRDHGSGIKYAWITFGTSTDVCLSDQVWVESEFGDGRYRNIKIDLLGYTGSPQAWPASSSTTYTITSVDPGYIATAPSIDIAYPSPNVVLPVDGAWMVRGDVQWIASPGTVVVEYTTNGSTWNNIGSMTNTTGDTWEYVGGTIPSGVLGLRMRATPPSGDEGSLAIDLTSATYSLVLEDNFTAANGTAIDGSYTSWTTNTTGNVYGAALQGATVESNTARGTDTGAHGNVLRIDVNASTSLVVECVAVAGTAGEEVSAGPAVRVANYFTLVNGGVVNTTGTTGCFRLRQRNEGLIIDKSANYGSYSRTNPYRCVLQIVGTGVVLRVYDGVALVATLHSFDVVDNYTEERSGFTVGASSQSSSIDDLKVYVP